jgi:hypothetical protein
MTDGFRKAPTNELDDVRSVFERDRYVPLKSLLDDPALTQSYQYVCALTTAGLMKGGDQLVPGTACRYGDPIMEDLLETLQPAIEQACGLLLYPTYSYVRLYKTGDQLGRHTDRHACEISVTLCLGRNSSTPWPIHIDGPHGSSAVELNPGDALLYRGIECAHWRTPYQGEQLAQLFLHYVDRNGPHADWKFDRRPSLSGIDTFTGRQRLSE